SRLRVTACTYLRTKCRLIVRVATGGATASPPPLSGEGQGGGVRYRSYLPTLSPPLPPQAGEGAVRARGAAVPCCTANDRCVHALPLAPERAERRALHNGNCGSSARPRRDRPTGEAAVNENVHCTRATLRARPWMTICVVRRGPSLPAR